jgi:NADH dehydrogenase
MKIAITGGTGFVGGQLARELVRDGHQVVLVARGMDRRDLEVRGLSGASLELSGLDDPQRLERAFRGCEAVAHCAGINREIGRHTFQLVHVEGTRNVVEAARRAGARRLAILSFLRARPGCKSGYHESKWEAEEIVRASDLEYTVLKAGVIYGRGDHMLDHLSHAFHTFPLFALVGFEEHRIRPVAVGDVTAILRAAIVGGRLARRTVAVTGPEEMTLAEAVKRVAGVVGKSPLYLRMPVWFHRALACCLERVMTIPLVSLAQVRILTEDLTDPFQPGGGLPGGGVEALPPDLTPRTPFGEEQIRSGLPPPGPFSLRDLRLFARREAKRAPGR